MGEGWHLYSLNQPPPPIATRITVAKGQPFAVGGPIDGPLPQTAFDQSFGIDTEFYADSAAFTLPVKAEANAPGGKTTVKVQAYYQSCNDTMCLPPKTVTMEVPIEVAGPGRAWRDGRARACCPGRRCAGRGAAGLATAAPGAAGPAGGPAAGAPPSAGALPPSAAPAPAASAPPLVGRGRAAGRDRSGRARSGRSSGWR